MAQAEPEEGELERIASEYRRRRETLPATRDSLTDPATLFRYQQRSRVILSLLAAHGMLPLLDKTILDVGCGGGQSLLDFESWGARRQHLAGLDLLEDSVHIARLRLCSRERSADIRQGNAAQLPWADRTFDIVNQSTVFTSVLSDSLRRSMASEMLRVVRPTGVILWYDAHVNNPANPHIRRVGASEVRALFAGCEVHLRRTTLAPPIARRLVPVSWMAAMAVEKLRFFNTHYVGVIRPPRTTDGTR